MEGSPSHTNDRALVVTGRGKASSEPDVTVLRFDISAREESYSASVASLNERVMMEFQFDDDIDIGTDDEISVGDDVRSGDIVFFERMEGRKVVIRKAAEEDFASPSIRVYRIERGDSPNSVRFTRLR